jgi:hypothetical protein
MALTDAQIERYSRQIIVPHLGGRGQERLLAARLLLVGDAPDIEAPLAYLVGAGVGTVDVRVADGAEKFAEKIAEMRQLNTDVTLRIADELEGRIDLAFLIIGSEVTRKVVDQLDEDLDLHAVVIARFDRPLKVVVIPDAQSPRIVDASMLTSVGVRSEAADFIAMVATAEAFKLLARYDENPSPVTIEFDGYETKVRPNP